MAIVRSQVGSYLAPGEEKGFEGFLDSVEQARRATYFVVATFEGEAIGCGGIVVTDDCATLAWGILKAGCLSRGFGNALLHHRIEWVRAHHPQVMSVLSDTAPLTEGFFAKNGFDTYYREEKYWAGQIDLVAMELSIDGVRRGPERTGRVPQEIS
jgi:[ribosomal protein S18]-alanine N-acetyltransferase